jgi:hypothetical protein
MRLLLCLAVMITAAAFPLFGQTPLVATRSEPDSSTKRAWSKFATQSAIALKQATAVPADVPDTMKDLPELSFKDFFGPIGPGGLEYSAKIKALNGQRVRVRGFLVQQTERSPALFLFAGTPVKVDTRADCNETDTPPAMIHVFVPGTTKALPWVPGQHFISGVLELGARHEADDRISVARLQLDEPARAALFGPTNESVPVAAR